MSGPKSTVSHTGKMGQDARVKGSQGNDFVSSSDEDSRDSFSSVSFSSDSEIEGKVNLGTQKKTEKRSTNKGSVSSSGNRHGAEVKEDVPSKLSFILRDTRYFIMKSNNEDNIELSKSRSVWSTPPANESRINTAVRETRNVILIFSVKESGKFSGFARLAGESTRGGQPVNWVLPPGLSERALGGVFPLDWISMHEVPFTKTQHLFNPWNDGKPVKIGRDGQEIEPHVAVELCRLFALDSNTNWNRVMERSTDASNRIKSKRFSGPLGGGIPSSARNRGDTRGRVNSDFSRQPTRSNFDGRFRGDDNGMKRRYNEVGFCDVKRPRASYTRSESRSELRYSRERNNDSTKAYSGYTVRDTYHRPPPPPMPYPPPPPFDAIPPPPRYYDVPPLPDYPPELGSGNRRLDSSSHYEGDVRRRDRDKSRYRQGSRHDQYSDRR